MKITGGRLKGRTLKTPADSCLRPTSGVIRESLFNILQERVSRSVFADLFAGSGSVGIEAISRGAEKVLFVENNRQALKLLADNIKKTAIEKHCIIIKRDVEKALFALKQENLDIIFLDPPYHEMDSDSIQSLFKLIVDSQLLNESNMLVLQFKAKFDYDMINIESLTLYKYKKYGKTGLTFWKKQ
jgi:16S rRNA (guanine966-N2)-methyltransferase